MLSDNEKDELQYRLALRVAHLLGDDAEARKTIVDQVKDLYKIRSQIVHSGKFRVTGLKSTANKGNHKEKRSEY